jgi:hypothetical protein
MPSSADDEDAQQQLQQSGCKRPHASSELWEFESLIAAEPPKSKVVLGVDGGGTCTVCVCVAAPVVVPRDGSLPLLSRCVTASSNHNSVGGKLFTHSLLCSFVPLLLLLLLFLRCCFFFLELDFTPPERRFFFPPPTHFQVLIFFFSLFPSVT